MWSKDRTYNTIVCHLVCYYVPSHVVKGIKGNIGIILDVTPLIFQLNDLHSIIVMIHESLYPQSVFLIIVIIHECLYPQSVLLVYVNAPIHGKYVPWRLVCIYLNAFVSPLNSPHPFNHFQFLFFLQNTYQGKKKHMHITQWVMVSVKVCMPSQSIWVFFAWEVFLSCLTDPCECSLHGKCSLHA